MAKNPIIKVKLRGRYRRCELLRVYRDGAIKNSNGKIVETPEEIDVFNLLGLKWLDPQDRKDRPWRE